MSLLEQRGRISFADLTTDTKNPNILRDEFVTADHFINLIGIAGLGSIQKIEFKNGYTTDINLIHTLRDYLRSPDKDDGQEPGDD